METASLKQQSLSAISILGQYRRVLIGSVLFCTLGGIAFALTSPKVYQASQPFIVRDEISGKFLKPGRFDSMDALKSAQETIQEIVKNPEVLRSALATVGPDNWLNLGGEYPSDEAIESFRNQVWISAPNGSELGKTEVIHLNVRATSRERAFTLLELISQGASKQMRTVRSHRAKSIQGELMASVESSKQRLNETTDRVIKLEQSLGADLLELRALETVQAGDSALRSALLQVEKELLTSENQQQQIKQQIAFFNDALANPGNLLGMPNELLDQFQSLRELKLGLVRTKLNLSTVLGKYYETSTQVKQLQNEVQSIESQIRTELEVAINGAKAQTKFVSIRVDSLNSQRDHVLNRLTRLADVRAPYQNMLEEQRAATQAFRDAQTELSQAAAVLNGANTVNLLTSLEKPNVGTNPVSLSRSNVVAGSVGCGVFIGLGLIMFLSAPAGNVSPEALDRLSRERDSQIHGI